MKNDIQELYNEMQDKTIRRQKKWIPGTFITLVILILGLYAVIFLKH